MASINALMGRGLSTEEQQQQMANRLRGEQADGDYMSLSTIKPVAGLGQQMQNRSMLGAKAVGGVNAATIKNNRLKKAVNLANFEKEEAVDLANDRKVEAVDLANDRTVEAVDLANDRNVLAKTVETGRKKDAASTLATANLNKADTINYIDPKTGKPVNLNQRTDGVYTYPDGSEVPDGFVRHLEQSQVTNGKGGSGSGRGFAIGTPQKMVRDGKLRSIFYDPNIATRGWYDADELDENGRAKKVRYSDFKPLATITQKDRESLTNSYDGVQRLHRMIKSVPKEAFHKLPSSKGADDGDFIGQALVRTFLGDNLPMLPEHQWISPKGAGFWRDKEYFVDMVLRNKMFGGALTKPELERWAKANISANNTFAQGMQSMEDLTEFAMEKMEARIQRQSDRGVPDYELESFQLNPELTAKRKSNADLRKNGFLGDDYYQLKRDARKYDLTVNEYVKKLQDMQDVLDREEAEKELILEQGGQ